MRIIVDTDTGDLSLSDPRSFIRGEYVPTELVFLKKGVAHRHPENLGIGITMKKWTAPGGDLLVADTGITRPDADRTPYTTTLNLNSQNLLDEFTTNVTFVDCSLEVRWEDAVGSGHYHKSNRYKVRIDADTYRDGDEAAGVSPLIGAPFVTTAASGLLSNEKVLTGSSTVTVTSGASTVTLTIPSNVALPGSPTTTTQAYGDDSTKIATTAFVHDAVVGMAGDAAIRTMAELTAALAAAQNDEVIDVGVSSEGGFSISASLSDSLTGGVTGVKLSLHEGTVLLYASTALAYADRALFFGNDRDFHQFGGVGNDSSAATQNALSWRTALASAGADDFTNSDGTYGSTALLAFRKSEGTTTIFYFDEEMHLGARAGIAQEIDTFLRWKAGFAPAAGTAIGTAFTTVTGAAVIALTNHGLQEGQRVQVSGTIPGELSTGRNYWVKWVSDDTFSLCSSPRIHGATPIALTNGAAYSGTVTKMERFGVTVLSPAGGGAGNTHDVQIENLVIDCEVTNNEGFSCLNAAWAQSSTIKRFHAAAGERIYFQRSGSSALTIEHAWVSRNEYAGLDTRPCSLMQIDGGNAVSLNSVRLINHNTVACDDDGDLYPALAISGSYHNAFTALAFEGCRAGLKLYAGNTTNNFAAVDGYCTDAGYEGESEHKLVFTVDTGTNIFTTASAHGFTAGQRVQLSTAGTLPTHTAATLFVAATDYFVSATSLGATTFRLALTSSGAVLDIDGAGSGTLYVKPPTYLITARGLNVYDNSFDTARAYYFDYHTRDLSYNAANVQRSFEYVCGATSVSRGYTQDRMTYAVSAETLAVTGAVTFGVGGGSPDFYSTIDQYGVIRLYNTVAQQLALSPGTVGATGALVLTSTTGTYLNPDTPRALYINGYGGESDCVSIDTLGVMTLPGLILDGHAAGATGKDLLATTTAAEAMTVLGIETPDTTVRGIVKHIWASNRTDSEEGSGTAEDPFHIDSTAGGIYTFMADIAKVPSNSIVYLYPGTYEVTTGTTLSGALTASGATGVQLVCWPGANLTWADSGNQATDTAAGLNQTFVLADR